MLFLLLLTLLLSNTTFASDRNEREIEGSAVYLFKDLWLKKGHRSITSTPLITQEGYLIRIYSDIDLPNLQICVKDASGDIVCFDTISVSAGVSYSFVLPEMQIEEAMIELIHEQKYLFGYLF